MQQCASGQAALTISGADPLLAGFGHMVPPIQISTARSVSSAGGPDPGRAVDPFVPVMGRDALGYPEHQEGRGDYDKAAYAPLSRALRYKFPWDAHFCAYSLPSVPRRLAKDLALALSPTMVLLVFDVDAPNEHRLQDESASSAWREGEDPKIKHLLKECPDAYIYTTRKGYRIIYRIEPITLCSVAHKHCWSETYLGAVESLYEECGIVADKHCADWTRLYRLPRVVRDGKATDAVIVSEPSTIGLWEWKWDTTDLPADEVITRAPGVANAKVLLPAEDKIDEAARVLGEAWPSKERHLAHLALSGGLARAGWEVDAITDFCVRVAEVQQPGNGNLAKRLKTARDSYDKLASGEAVTGWPTLRKYVDPEAVREACRLLGIEVLDPPEPGFFDEITRGAENSAATTDDETVLDAVLSPGDAVTYLNRRAAWIESVGRVAVLTADGEIDYQRVEAFKITHDNRRVKISEGEKDRVTGLGSFWLASPDRHSYERVGLYPPPSVAPRRALNLWSGFAVERRAGSWALMRAHIRDVIANGNPVLCDYIIRWIAWMFQNPGSRAEAAIALRGDEGVGKGMLGNALCALLGRHAVHVTNPEHFASGRFNAHMDRAIFLFADECHWPGDKKHEGTLKGMITEPTIRIEPTGIDSYEAPNRLHALISSNEKWIIPAGIDARRFVVADVSPKHRGDLAYFKALVHELDNGGREAMLHDLLAMDLGDWHPRQIVDTPALRDQKERSLGPEDQWFMGVLEDGVLPGACDLLQSAPPVGVAYTAALEAYARATVPVLRTRSARALIAIYKQVGAKPWRSADPRTRTRGWQFPPLAEVRLAWERTHFQRTWPECDDWTVGDRTLTR